MWSFTVSNTSPDPQSLFDSISKHQLHEKSKLPPVHKWNPDLSGDLDMRIDREGRWYYQGGEIKRHALVKLFSTILKYEDGRHYLVTPVEKWRITVDAQPFAVHSVKAITSDGVDALLFTLNDDSEVLLQEPTGFSVSQTESGEPIPLLEVRNNLNALANRNVFYQLVELAQESNGELIIASMGQEYSLGKI
jgi:uncharacterized protein